VTDEAAPNIGGPASADLCSAIAERVERALGESGEALGEVIRFILSSEDRVLSPRARPQSSAVVIAACISARGAWRRALWPAVAMECAMAAADVFDDIADGEATTLSRRFGQGGVLMGAAALLTLATGAVLRGVDDGLSEETVIALGRLLTAELVHAADGQTRFLSAAASRDAVGAYQLAAAKSGPLGSVAIRLGARTATDDPELLRLYGQFGWHLAVYSQLLNDARDAAPDGSRQKRDVREGRQTVPLVFAGSSGAPRKLSARALAEWEDRERQRVADAGGLAAALALAHAERLRATEVLDGLARLGTHVEPLQLLFGSSS
jgi:geranylgeranyl pyrophosphate synthase